MNAAVSEVSLVRLYLLRALYLLVLVGLAINVWPSVFLGDPKRDLWLGVMQSMLFAFSFLAVLGLRQPLRMLPLLLWELVWKVVWLGTVAYPLWSKGQMDARTAQTAFEVMFVVIFPFIIPWRYVLRTYVTAPAERWRAAGSTAAASQTAA
jgi:hypothetical protein